MKSMTRFSKTKTILLAIIFFGVFGVAEMSQAAYFVDNITSCGNGATNYNPASRNACNGADTVYHSPSTAHSHISAGTEESPTVVTLRAGTYLEELWIDKDWTTWQRYGSEVPLFDGNYVRPIADNKGIISINADHVVIDGLSVTRSRFYGIQSKIYMGEATKGKYNTIKNCNVSYTYLHGIGVGHVESESYSTIDNCTVTFGNYCKDLPMGCPNWAAISNTVSVKGVGNTVKNSTVAFGKWAGIELYRDNGSTIEYNTVYGNQQTQIHAAMSSNAIIRHNLIYGTERPVTSSEGYGNGINISTEFWYDGTGWDSGHKIYGNLVANCDVGILVSYADNGAYTTNTVSNVQIYNNTVVEPSSVKPDAIYNHALQVNTSGSHLSNITVKNNLFLQTTGIIAYCGPTCTTVNNAVVTFADNVWSKIPTTGFRSASDPGYSDYTTLDIADYVTKGSGWTFLQPGTLTGREFALKATASQAINKGAPLGAAYAKDYFGTVRPIGDGWDIGAHEYVSEGDSQAPASPGGLSVR